MFFFDRPKSSDYTQPRGFTSGVPMQSPSKSSDKLKMLCDAVEDFPSAKLMKIKTFNLNWELFNGVIVPTVKIEFFE